MELGVINAQNEQGGARFSVNGKPTDGN